MLEKDSVIPLVCLLFMLHTTESAVHMYGQRSEAESGKLLAHISGWHVLCIYAGDRRG